MTRPQVRRLEGFDDPALSPASWDALLRRSPAREVFGTRAWLSAWWASFGTRRRLLLLLAERGDEPVLLLPLFVDGGMGFLVGSGGSDSLDVVGDASDDDALEGLLADARAAIPGFVGFRFHLVPDDSPTPARLAAAAKRLGLEAWDEGELGAPRADLSAPGAAERLAGKDTLRRRERWFQREGVLEVRHLVDPADVLPHLDAFFDQHVRRWSGTSSPSLFLDPVQRGFYRAFVRAVGAEGDLRFTRLDWNGEPIAFHLGFLRHGTFLWYKPTFEPRLAARSPGAVLLRALFLAAAAEGVRVFDFGLGDEPFKSRFADGRRVVRTWGLYPARSGGGAP